jgi:hypothetical protein
VGNDHDGVVLLQLEDQLLDLLRGNRVQRRSRLVHEQHLGLIAQGAGDTQPLLLSTR